MKTFLVPDTTLALVIIANRPVKITNLLSDGTETVSELENILGRMDVSIWLLVSTAELAWLSYPPDVNPTRRKESSKLLRIIHDSNGLDFHDRVKHPDMTLQELNSIDQGDRFIVIGVEHEENFTLSHAFILEVV